MPDHDIGEWRKREGLGWRQVLCIVAVVGMGFALPDTWAHWGVAALVGVVFFVVLVTGADAPGWRGGVGIAGIGLLMFLAAMAPSPPGTLLSGTKLMNADAGDFRWALSGAG